MDEEKFKNIISRLNNKEKVEIILEQVKEIQKLRKQINDMKKEGINFNEKQVL